MRVKDAVGRFGEQVAAQFLERNGLTVVDRNWRCAAGEIDIVARDGDDVVFCEVKTRSGDAFGTPAEAVTARKMAHMRVTARLWLEAHRAGQPWLRRAGVRFDVVSVRRGSDGVRVEHLRAVL